MENRVPSCYNTGMARIGFHPDEEEEGTAPECVGTGTVQTISEDEEEDTPLQIFFQIVTSGWASGLFLGALLGSWFTALVSYLLAT